MAEDSWYTKSAPDDDVVISTRMRLARNLANFPFPGKLLNGDGDRVRSIVFDAFNHLEDADSFQTVIISQLDELGAKILAERGVLKDPFAGRRNNVHVNANPGSKDDTESREKNGQSEQNDTDEGGLILKSDGTVACTVNLVDHVRIASFASGLDFDSTLNLAAGLDQKLQQNIQFAASYDFGYLTANVGDAGSGMKISLRLHLPCLSMQGRIGEISQLLASKQIILSASFGNAGQNPISACFRTSGSGSGTSLGAYYDMTLFNRLNGSEFDQIATLSAAGTQIVEMERYAREECKKNAPSTVRNAMYRSFALARSSIFVSLREAIDIISGVKLGKDMQLLTGIDDQTLHALLYRIQEGHLQYAAVNGNFKFEKDIEKDTVRKNERLRALILQESFEDVILAL